MCVDILQENLDSLYHEVNTEITGANLLYSFLSYIS